MELEKILSSRTVQELRDIAFRMDMMPPAKQAKKKEWVEALAEHLRLNPERIRRCISVDMLVAFRRDPGAPADPDALLEGHDWPEQEEMLHQLACVGLAQGKLRRPGIAPEAMDVLTFSDKELRALKAAEHLYVSMRGCVRVFGMIESERMGELVLPNTPEARSALVSIFSCRRGIEGVIRADGKLWLVDEMVENPKALYEHLTQKNMSEIPWAVYSMNDLAEAGVLGIPKMESVFGRIVNWYQHLELDLDEIYDDVEEAIHAAQTNEMEEYFSLLEGPFVDMEVPATFRHAEVEALRRIPMWGFKGHTVMELEKVMNKKTPMPEHWRDRCPCGSGKRYRACCGRFQ